MARYRGIAARAGSQLRLTCGYKPRPRDDLNKGTQIPGIAALYNGRTWEKGGVNPRWRGIYDDQGRLVVAINFNMDLGDAWEHADTPGYPEPMTAMAYRFAVNYVIYAMTH